MQIIVCKRVLLLLQKSDEATKLKPGLTVASDGKKWLQKAVRIMKIVAVLLLASCLQVTAAGHAQKISLSEKDAPIEKIFKKIERMTDYKFLYMSELLDKANKVTITVKDASVEQVLDLCLREQILEYEINENTIIIRPRSDLNEDAPAKLASLNAIEVRGVIIDENGAPAHGVNVMVKGTNKGTTTNLKGEFILTDVNERAVLAITSVGYERQEILVKNQIFITTQLKVAIGSLDELQVIAYGTTSKRLSTGNIVTVKAKDIEKQPVNNPLLALVARVPGVTIEQATGFANSGVVVRIQGTNSINSGLDPLYVIDGVPYLSQPLPTLQGATVVLGGSGQLAGGNPLSFINPQDIESIDILKDADATAIYGSRGANGVILITTKKGKAGKTKFDANVRSGLGRVVKKVDLLNTEQYLAMRKEGYLNDGVAVPDQNSSPNDGNYDLTVWDQDRYTDWQEELLGASAKYFDAQLGISGGNTNTQFTVGVGYHKETTVFPGDFGDRKGSFQFSLHHSSYNQKFKAQFSGNYLVDNNKIPQTDLTQYAVRLAPNAPKLYNSDGSLNWEPLSNGNSTWINPLSYLQNRYQNKVSNVIGNALLSYQLVPGLIIKSSFGYTNMQSDEIGTLAMASIRPERIPFSQRSGSYANANNNSWIIEPQATYQRSIGKGNLEVLLGSSFQQNNIARQQLSGLGHSSDLLLKDIRSASTINIQSSLSSVYKYNALFGRLNYNLQNKYILNLAARRDGSSRFGSENLFNNFWSAAAAWIFSKEKGLSNLSFLSFGKLRVSYGTSGNDQIGDYRFMNLFTPFTSGVGVPYQNVPALAPNAHTNPFLQWEETNKLQAGLDLGLLNDRFLLSVNYYHNRSSNLLVNSRLSIITGFNGVTENFDGVVQNTGLEMALNATIIQSNKFSWTASFNLTIPKHNGQLISFPNLDNTNYSNSLVIGKSLYDTRAYHSLGVDPATGKFYFADKNGNPTFSPTIDDLIAFKNVSTQRIYGGLQNNLRYKNFELDFTFQFVKKDGGLDLLSGGPALR